MIFTAIRRGYLLLTFFLTLSSFCLAQDESLSPYPGIIHVHSYISEEGSYPFRRLVTLAQSKGIKILVFSDTFLNRWEYGLPILSNIFKASAEKRCIVEYGIKNYLKDLEKIKDEFPDTVILGGAEVAPFYWFSGSIFKKNLFLNDWSRHLLVIGLKSYQDYARLPVICNRYFKPQLKDTFSLLIPIALIIFGVFLLKRRSPRKIPGFPGLKITGLTLNILGILFLFNAFPFSASRFAPYYGQKAYLPYQDLINYVNKKNGLVFWAHPMVTEETSSKKFLRINFYTPSYPEALVETTGYAGFGTGMPGSANDDPVLAGGAWDNALKDYCLGKRNQPAWVIGEAEYTGTGEIGSIQNIFFLLKFNTQSVYEALQNGRLYVRSRSENSINISLSDFHIEDSHDKGNLGSKAFMGDKIQITGSPRLFIKGDFVNNPASSLKVDVIRNGEVVKEFEFTNEQAFNLEFQDDLTPEYGKKSYFRLIFFADNRVISVTNPIFITGSVK